ncbi:hypothetical protein [Pontibacter mangrovi]|uniref:Uncharacterized protein n=1 Tax=Pontibacter mangrovi TaxID=2589816 RepID=A0A501W0A8_9BACT|nr:hypothetical protein [Pontibacter mangrovi]TPE40631.1 hypothetical protein FJM65_20045 [Pontibacter mangrovi]
MIIFGFALEMLPAQFKHAQIAPQSMIFSLTLPEGYGLCGRSSYLCRLSIDSTELKETEALKGRAGIWCCFCKMMRRQPYNHAV